MKSKKKYWDILLEKHTKTIYRAKIDINHISEKNLTEFIQTLLTKYALSDDEILEQFIHIPVKKRRNIISINRSNSNLNEPLNINFHAQIADYSISVNLTE